MKLLLTSTGLANENIREFFVSQFDRLDDKTACIITSSKNEEERFYVNSSIKELEDLGIKVVEFNIAKNENFTDFSKFDIYYVCGGNTFYILDRIKKTGVDKILIEATKHGKFYIGVSAGSIIPGPDIEVAGVGDFGDPNDINLNDLTGLKLTNLIVTPHYDQKEEKDIEKFREERKEEVITITDEQALFVESDGYKIIE